MTIKIDFAKYSDSELIGASLDNALGLQRALAISELAVRALDQPELLPHAIRAIETDKKIRIHTGTPLGWLGADDIYSSGREPAIRCLLKAMEQWDEYEQQDLVRLWAGPTTLPVLTKELKEKYGWTPRYPPDAK
jgi:hypothetical protein